MRCGWLWMAILATALPVAAQPPASTSPAPEEPDFFFLTGGPYTQTRKSFQIIWANQFLRDRDELFPIITRRDFIGAGRFEWGFTDRLEFDLEFGYLRRRERVAGSAALTRDELDDVMLGVRYRLLREGSAPLTLTTGPQIILPSPSPLSQVDTASFAWDLALARDFGGPVFTLASVNVRLTPHGAALPLGSGSSGRFGLETRVDWGAAVGLRPLERDTGAGSHHDVHLYLEFGGTRTQELAGRPTNESLVAPGLRYGFLTRHKVLAEVGLSFPVGLNRAALNWGVIVQLQFEYPF